MSGHSNVCLEGRSDRIQPHNGHQDFLAQIWRNKKTFKLGASGQEFDLVSFQLQIWSFFLSQSFTYYFKFEKPNYILHASFHIHLELNLKNEEFSI